MSNNPQRDEILRRLDIAKEYELQGGRIGNRPVSLNGWLEVFSVDREEKKPSAAINISQDPNKRGIYTDLGPGGRPRSFFDLMCQLPNSPWMTGEEVYQFFAKQTGVEGGDNGTGLAKVEKPAPTLADVEKFQGNLSPETRQFLKDKRGLTEDSLLKYRVGWCLKRQRNAFPVFDENNNLVNIRFHNSKKEPKTLNWSGYGTARLWGLERLAKAAPGITVAITEGEFDAMLVEQETGMLAVSGTNGAKAFKKDWVKPFHGFHVVLLYDCDQAGREAVHGLVLPAFKEAVLSGQVLSLKIVWLYDKPDKGHKDFTDYIVKDGGSGAALRELIRQAEPYAFPTLISHLETPTVLPSFELIDRAKWAGRRVTVPLQIFGENTVAYHAPSKLTVASCPLKRDSKCTGRKTAPGACMQEIVVPLGDRVLIAGVRATDGQLMNHLRAYVCDKDKNPSLTIKDEDRLTIREVYAHQVVGPMAAERIELVEKPIYIIGGGLVEIGKYQATGRVVTSYRDQQPTLLVDTLDRLEEDYQVFDLEKCRPSLEKLQALGVHQIVENISQHITKIYERIDIHLGNLMVIVSPLEIDFPGDGRIRGRTGAINVGDTGTGKTTIVSRLCDAAGVGLQVSGMTASRTGITYGCEHDERRGWRIKAGAFLKMNRQILMVDEAQDLKSEDLKTMAEGFDTGLTRIDRIQNKIFESQTRVIFNCNPRHPKKIWEQRTMDSYRYGCEAIKGIFPQMMIRRIDLVLFSTAWDVDKEKIFFPTTQESEPLVTPADLRALVFFAWNLKPEQIIITPKVGQYIRKIAKYLCAQFGGSDDLPIVYPEDFRKTMARLSVAYAILDLATDKDFSQVTVNEGHVAESCEFLERVYGAQNCNLQSYTKAYLAAHGLGDIDKIQEKIDGILMGETSIMKRFHHIMYSLFHCDGASKLRVGDLADEFEVGKKTMQRDLQFFINHKLVEPGVQNGYKPQPKFFRLIEQLKQIDPVKYNFEVHYSQIYPD